MKNIILLSYLILCPFISVFSQTTIKGIITDADGEALIAASIVLKGGEGVGTSTDIDGTFSLDLPDAVFPFFLSFSYTGYASQEWEITNADYITVKLVESVLPHGGGYLFSSYDESPIVLNKPVPYMRLRDMQLSRDNDFEIYSSLNRVPGVFMQTGTLNLNRLSIRGVGARSTHSTRKTRIYLDDIPLTTGDGSSAIEEIDLSLIQEVDVWKGPTGSTYGAGLGGTIHLKTPNFFNSLEGRYVNSKFTFGSFGMLRNATDFSYYNKEYTASLNINLNTTHNNGYRENNKFDRSGISILGKFRPNDKNQTTILANYSMGNAFTPHALSENNFLNFPKKANDLYAAVNAFEDFNKILLGVSHKIRIAKINDTYLVNKTTLFGNFRNSNEKIPISFLEKERQNFGIRTSFGLNKYGNLRPNLLPQFSIGMEVVQEDYEFSAFNILNGEKDDKWGIFSSKKRNLNFFSQSYFEFLNQWTLLAGVNLNQTNNNYNRIDLSSGAEFNGDRNFNWILSPRIGLTYEFPDYLTIHSSASHGFSPPNTGQIFPGSNAIDNKVQPETGWNFETGIRGYIAEGIKYELSFYQMNINDLLVDVHYFGQTYGVENSGKTKYQGIEGYAEYDMYELIYKSISFYTSYSFNNSKFETFDNGDEDLSGNRIPGVPQHHFNFGLDFDLDLGLYGNMNFQHISPFQMNDQNTFSSEGYSLINLKIGYKYKYQKNYHNRFQFDFFGGIRNLSNTKYASLINVNARNSSVSPDFYYSGLPINFYGGVNLKFFLNPK